jgi:hypothetical protein
MEMMTPAGLSRVVAPLIEHYAERAAVLENRHMLLPRLQAAADGRWASGAVAAAALQSGIEELATSVGAGIGNTKSLSAEARSGCGRTSLRHEAANTKSC